MKFHGYVEAPPEVAAKVATEHAREHTKEMAGAH
jgi:hypothetical protein